MKIIFFGTPDYILPIVEKLNKSFKSKKPGDGLITVVTQPPRPAGRGKKIEYSAVDKWAYKTGKQVIYEPEKISEADLGVVAAYGKIIPKKVINRFKYGILNIHPSLLPKYRGASPIQETIENGDKATAVSVIKMDEKMDHGPIVSVLKEEVRENDDAVSLRDRLFEKSADFIIELIPGYINNKIKLTQQDHSKATFTKMIKREDGYIDALQLTKDPKRVLSLIKAMKPWPGVWTIANGKRLKIINAHTENNKIILDEVQLEGKNPVKWSQFKVAYPQIAMLLS